jgi:glycosyltransferase involved in cell wall biosynthesis
MNISVALCTYNGERYLHDQLLSISQQIRLPDSVVICDDCSSDATVQIVNNFSAPFTLHFYPNKQNLGSTRNFEQAIRLCTGDIIVLSDQDDYWYPDKLAIIEETFHRNPNVGLVFSNADVVDNQRRLLGYTLWETVRFDYQQQQQFRSGQALKVLLRHPVVTGATLAFRSDFRDLILPIGLDWIHDEWIAFLIAIVAPVDIIPKPLIQYRLHGRNQVGAESIGFIDRLKTALATNPDVYLKRYEQYQNLYQHILQRLPDKTDILAQVAGKISHFYARGTLPHPRLKRIMPVFGELLNGHYHNYSGSVLNAIRDLALRHKLPDDFT